MNRQQADNRRRFLRHPAGIPVVCRRRRHRDECPADLRNMGLGGMAFITTLALQPGDVVTIECPTLHAEGLEGEVVWSDVLDDGTRRYRCGIKFQERSTFARARLVEQLARIETYRKSQQAHGRPLARNAAAQEWIEREADKFPE